MGELNSVHYRDEFFGACPAGVGIQEILKAFVTGAPTWVHGLMRFRNSLVSMFGLKTGRSSLRTTFSDLKVGDRLGLFYVYEIKDDYALIGADDSHLNFRIVFNKKDQLLSCITQVHFNNALGRAYFFFVKPFHKLIVPAMLKSMLKQLDKDRN